MKNQKTSLQIYRKSDDQLLATIELTETLRPSVTIAAFNQIVQFCDENQMEYKSVYGEYAQMLTFETDAIYRTVPRWANAKPWASFKFAEYTGK